MNSLGEVCAETQTEGLIKKIIYKTIYLSSLLILCSQICLPCCIWNQIIPDTVLHTDQDVLTMYGTASLGKGIRLPGLWFFMTCSQRGLFHNFILFPNSCLEKCSIPSLDHGVISNTKLSYKIGEILPYSCNSNYWTPRGNREETIQCLSSGWSAQPRCMKTTANGKTLIISFLKDVHKVLQAIFLLV